MIDERLRIREGDLAAAVFATKLDLAIDAVMYQRGKIQDESMVYEIKKHDGSLPLIGVNTFLPKEQARRSS